MIKDRRPRKSVSQCIGTPRLTDVHRSWNGWNPIHVPGSVSYVVGLRTPLTQAAPHPETAVVRRFSVYVCGSEETIRSIFAVLFPTRNMPDGPLRCLVRMPDHCLKFRSSFVAICRSEAFLSQVVPDCPRLFLANR